MTLAACIKHSPIHRFGKGWVCARCGVPCNPKPIITREWLERRAAMEGELEVGVDSAALGKEDKP